MKIFINQDSKKFVSSQKFNAIVNRFDFKRGDTAKIELGYVQDNELIQLAGAYTIVFGIKEDGKYDGDYVVYEAVFVYNATTGFYEAEPNFNTTELNDLLNANDGDPTNDIPFVDCLFEITATDDNGISSSATSTARVFHDVNKGNEGIPTGANPSYSVVGHTHTALDNLAVTNDFTVDTDTLHVDSTSNRVGVGTNSPAASLHVLGQQLRIDDPNSGVYLYTGVTELGYIQALTGNLMRVVQSQPLPLAFYTSNTEAMRLDAGGNLGIGTTSPSTKLEVNGTQSFTSNSGTWDGATFAGAQSFTSTTLTAPNLVSTDPDSLVKRSDLNALYTHGIEDHNSTDVSFSPAAGVKTKVLNNGLGSFTNTAYKIPGRGDIWDASTSEFDFLNAGLELGDTVTIRMDFELTTTSANDGFKVELDLGTGGNLYTLTLADQYYRFTGTNNFTVISEIYMGDANTLDNPGTIYITPDAAGSTIKYNGHYVKYSLRTPSID